MNGWAGVCLITHCLNTRSRTYVALNMLAFARTPRGVPSCLFNKVWVSRYALVLILMVCASESSMSWAVTSNGLPNCSTVILINLTATYSRNYYFQSLKTLGQGIPRPNSLCYNVSVHFTHQTHCHTTTLSLYPPTPVHNSLTISPSLASTNFTHVAVHHAAGNVEAQHEAATPHTTWIIPLVIIITIIILICFKFPQKAWNKFTQYRYSDMLAAA
ncbi:membrane protein UL6/membrane glycoprotein UL9 fusion protein [Human betaherpesvirus 5]|uniref:Membrane protein UL6/membrane glycoprotein UL9 fusion protein n=1 Tax=Human cytomegalovirus TaxID=10359 RepID=J7EHN4_HCMV|nr:membrane protein UL6/membrane glycoprotein UL9 fusion protein [Human betaherpesvirus 5]